LSDSWGGLIDLPNQVSATVLDRVVTEFMHGSGDEQISWHAQQRSVARLVPIEWQQSPIEDRPIRAEGTYLIAGGLGALGRQLARWAIEQGARSLVLLGRRGPSAAIQQDITEWQQAGVTVEVIQADVADRQALQTVLEQLRKQVGPLRGVFHVAGSLADGWFLEQNWAQFSSVMAPKIQGTWNLHTLTSDDELELFVCFSSVASVLGSAGQSNYAAANAFLDGLMQYRQSKGLPGLSINWGPWAETGMAANRQDQFTAQGITPIPIHQGFELLDDLLVRFESAQVGVLPVDWERFCTQFPTVPSLLESLLPSRADGERSTVKGQPLALMQLLEVKETAARQEWLVDYLRSQLQEIAGLASAQTLDIQRPLQDFGADSLMLTDFRNRIKADLAFDIPIQQFFGKTTLATLATYLQTRLTQSQTEPVKALEIQPVANDRPQLLSYNQELAWIMNELEPRSGVLLLLARVKLQGSLNIDIFRQSLQAILHRHQVLRTTFQRFEGNLQGIVASDTTPALSVIDLSHLSEDKQQKRLQQLDEREAITPFDLEQGPLLRATLLRLGPQTHFLLLSLHHIVADIYSLNRFVEELAALYTAFAAGNPSPLPELPIQYADFAAWQRQVLHPEALERQIQAWKQHIGLPLPVVNLPSDRPRPANPSFRTHAFTSALPNPLAGQLKELSRNQGLTLFMTLTCGLKLLLSRYTGESDLLLVAPVANRNQVALEPLIGFFASALVIRTQLGDNPTVAEAMDSVRDSVLKAHTYQELPFIKLVEGLNADSDRDPLARIWIDMVGPPHETFELPGLTAEFSITNGGFGSKFDLLLGIVEHSDCLELKWIFSTDLFDADTIERLALHFETLLQGMANDVEQQLSDLPLLTALEAGQLAHSSPDLDSLDSPALLDQLDNLSDEAIETLLTQMLADT
ncbi:MAG: SDR family NAD(P)-dependent oxidoreductase, partial [Cyanobacteria bacterium P01_E01_bin.34]